MIVINSRKHTLELTLLLVFIHFLLSLKTLPLLTYFIHLLKKLTLPTFSGYSAI